MSTEGRVHEVCTDCGTPLGVHNAHCSGVGARGCPWCERCWHAAIQGRRVRQLPPQRGLG
jgi:hypothetical protein